MAGEAGRRLECVRYLFCAAPTSGLALSTTLSSIRCNTAMKLSLPQISEHGVPFSTDQFIFPHLLLLLPLSRTCDLLQPQRAVHNERTKSTENEELMSEIINFYNTTKSGVDVLDKLVREYSCRRATRRWSLSLFLHLVDIAAYNAFVIWNTKYPTWEDRHKLQMRRKMFIGDLGIQLTKEHIDARATAFENHQLPLPASVLNSIESTGRII